MSTGFVDYLHSASAMNKSDTQGVLCSKDDGLIHPHVPSAFWNPGVYLMALEVVS